MKKFLQWIGVKEKLDSNDPKPPFVSEGDIWWVSFGENVGSEINGKSDVFTRPAIILKKLAHGFYCVVPTTSKHKEGSWYVSFQQKNKDTTACLHQVRTIDHRRLFSKLGTLDDSDFQNIKNGFQDLYLG